MSIFQNNSADSGVFPPHPTGNNSAGQILGGAFSGLGSGFSAAFGPVPVAESILPTVDSSSLLWVGLGVLAVGAVYLATSSGHRR